MITSTCRVSNHSRARLAPMSVLPWWSALISSIGLPSTVLSLAKSSIASSAAATEPLPELSADTPDMSVSTPILTTSSLMPAACAHVAASNASVPSTMRVPSRASRLPIAMSFLSCDGGAAQ